MIRVPGFLCDPGDRERLRQFIREKHPTTMISLNDVSWAIEMLNMGVPDVILRIKTDSINDDQLHMIFRDALEWWDAVKHNYEDKRIIVYVGNELNGDWNRINKFLSDVMQIISTSGRRGVYGNFGVGNPEPAYWQTYLNGFVDLVSKTSGQYVGLHEYFTAHPFLGIEGYTWSVSGILNTSTKPMNERTKWILGRFEFLTRLNSDIKVMITEFGADYVSAIAQQFGFPTSMRGWRSQFNGDENKVLELYKLAISSLYTNKQIYGIIMFVFEGIYGWNDFAYRNAETILSRWNELGVEIQMGKVINQIVQIKAKTTTPYSIRLSPVTGTVIGKSPTDWWICTEQEQDTAVQPGYIWSRFTGLKLDTGLTGGGWIRRDGIDIQPIAEPEPTPDPSQQFLTIPIPEVYYGGLTAREKEIAVAMLRWTEFSAKALADYVEKGIL